LLKPRACNPETTPAAGAPPANPPPEATVDTDGRAKKRSQSPERRRSNTETCSCCSDDGSTSDESIGEAKKKLRRGIAQVDAEVIIKKLERDKASSNAVESVTKRRGRDGIRSDAERYRTTVYINVTDVEPESAETKNAISPGGRADGDVGESRESIEIRNIDRALSLEASADWPNVRQLEEKGVEAISKTDESPRTRHVQMRDYPEVEQDEARIVDDNAISQKPRDVSSLEITLKLEEEGHTEQKEGKKTPLIGSETNERSAGEAKATNKCQKKMRFQFVSLMTNIVYDGQPEHQSERKTAESGRKMCATSTERLKRCPMKGVLKDAPAGRCVTKKDCPKCIFRKRPDVPKVYVDHSCQTILKLAKEDKTACIRDPSRTSVFPPLKYKLRKRTMGRLPIYLFV